MFAQKIYHIKNNWVVYQMIPTTRQILHLP